MKIYNELESLGFFEWLKEKGFGSGFTPIILDAQPFDSIERSGYNAIAFRWFREKYNTLATIYSNASGYLYEWHDAIGGTQRGWSEYEGPNDSGVWDTYEEAELECLKRLIEIV